MLEVGVFMAHAKSPISNYEEKIKNENPISDSLMLIYDLILSDMTMSLCDTQQV